MDLITRLLERDPAKRITAEEACNHPWLKGDTASAQPLDTLVLKGLQSFTRWPRIKRLVLKLMTHNLSELEVSTLKVCYLRIAWLFARIDYVRFDFNVSFSCVLLLCCFTDHF
jgi:calcium-dependent protein kinase